MCGIAGFVGDGDGQDLSRMANALAHRGPDGEGAYSDSAARVHLAHKRLAIIDVDGGRQPMLTSDGNLCVVFNGEIYNHVELRHELERLGHVFKTSHSDTEVLLHGYAAWGKGLPGRLNGMFAFALYDKRRRRLFLARDRFGEKPLYYAKKGRLFLFGSELTAIAAHSSFDASLSVRSIQKFLAYGFLPAPNSILEHVQKLPGGHYLIYNVDDGETQLNRYWRFDLQSDPEFNSRDDNEVAEEMIALFDQGVRRRLISDVPLGLFLSGGVDSSAALSAACNVLNPETIRTFTIGFKEPSFDESAAAAYVARHFNVSNSIEVLSLETARQLIEPVLSRLDDPLGDGSLLPTYMLARFTRKHVTVALSGDGGDELFGGYDPFAALPWARLYKAGVPEAVHHIVQSLALRLPVSGRNMSLDFKIKRVLRGLCYPPEMWTPVWMSPADPAMIADIMREPLSAEELYEEAIQLWDRGGKKSHAEKLLEYFTTIYLQDDILVKSDRASMMNSLESRSVFLDNDLVDFCARLPLRFKIRNGKRKYILKEAMRSRLPDSILRRPKKGFGAPLTEWLRNTPAEPPLAPKPGVDTSKLARAWKEHRAGQQDHRLLLWSWLSLQLLPHHSETARLQAA